MGGYAAVPMQDGQQHCQSVLVQAQRYPAWIGQVTVIYQCLDFHQHRPCAFPCRHDHTARDFFLGTGQKNSRRIGDFFQALVGHAEHAQFVNRAETIFYRPQQAQAPVGFTFKIQYGVDHVLQHPRPRQGAFLGHVPHKENRGATLFGITHQQRRAFANLRHATRRRLQLLGENRLDRVDHHDPGLFQPGGGNDGFNAGFGHDP
ncbi:hypothetical protein D3C76_839840 [compost metagenome]